MGFMIKVGLTGSRFSGKNTICNEFIKLGIPVFDADTILKFIINHDFTILDRIKKRVGVHVFKPPYIDASMVTNKQDFNKIIDCVESELIDAYYRFNKKNYAKSMYTVFLSSILFERGWNKTNMDFTINIHCPKNMRLSRSTLSPKETFKLLKNEFDGIKKNEISDFVIHNYGIYNVKNQIEEIDKKLIKHFMDKQLIEHSNRVNNIM
jgi:dephospho-CoA kinase